MNCLLCKTTRVEATELFSRKYLGKQRTIRLAIVLLDNISLYSHHLRSALQALNCWFSHMLYVKDNRACFSTVKYYYDAFANSYVRTTLYGHLGRRGLESPLASTFLFTRHTDILGLYISNQIKSIKSNHFYCHITTAQVPWWVKFLWACSRQCKKKTTIYIWTVRIYRLYRRQCAKYTYIRYTQYTQCTIKTYLYIYSIYIYI